MQKFATGFIFKRKVLNYKCVLAMAFQMKALICCKGLRESLVIFQC